MKSYDFDLITVGGGLGGSALAKNMAESGARVLVVERERQFSDRIRGEWIAPWGVAEAQRIGIYDTLLEHCAHELPNFETMGMGPPRDLMITTLQRLPALALHHPAMQQALIESARAAGAEVWRGAAVREVRPGKPPAVRISLVRGSCAALYCTSRAPSASTPISIATKRGIIFSSTSS